MFGMWVLAWSGLLLLASILTAPQPRFIAVLDLRIVLYTVVTCRGQWKHFRCLCKYNSRESIACCLPDIMYCHLYPLFVADEQIRCSYITAFKIHTSFGPECVTKGFEKAFAILICYRYLHRPSVSHLILDSGLELTLCTFIFSWRVSNIIYTTISVLLSPLRSSRHSSWLRLCGLLSFSLPPCCSIGSIFSSTGSAFLVCFAPDIMVTNGYSIFAWWFWALVTSRIHSSNEA